MSCSNKRSPDELTPEERAYYRETWGFDPVADKKNSPPRPHVSYFYDALIPLENDPELQAAGVELYAQVNVDQQGESHNCIVFTRGDKAAEVECVHTAVYAAPAQEILDFPGEKFEELIDSNEGRPAILPSWEHFAGATVNC